MDNAVANLRGHLSRQLAKKDMKNFWELIQDYFWLKVGLHEYAFDTRYVKIAEERSNSAREYIIESLRRAEDLGTRNLEQLEEQLPHLIQYQITWNKYAICSFDCGPVFMGKSFTPSFSMVAKQIKKYQSEYENQFREILAIEDRDEKKNELRDFAVNSLSELYDFELLYHREPLAQIINYGAFIKFREPLCDLIKHTQDTLNGIIENENLNMERFSFLPE